MVEFIDYSMRYRPELDLVLDDLSFAVRRNEKVGIVGRTGAGKSSITYALMRLVEAEKGQIKIDGIDISSIGIYDLRSKITIIPQDPVLFEGTIRDNLDPMNKYTDKEVWDAINACQIGELLDEPTEKYVYDLDDDSNGPWIEGVGLQKWIKPGFDTFSVGQAQLVSLCRALLWKCKIIVLDEATANVDSKTDKIIQKVIRERFNNCTVLTIAHRLNTIMDSDRILVLDHGQVKEFDTPANLLANKDSHFTGLVESMKLSEALLKE
ncbi:hypothetical protein LPJ56_004000 [Coemansia sp. RSA 2599]|nr:hypothetical protein LPJ75_003321 [Coemansia sp. RSA 2598]KAJ1817707.1 hypothetical protein LPJ56_004000 [Coemansia sp. RSA 2599]